MQTYKITFVKCEATAPGFTAGKNYPVVTLTHADMIQNDEEKLFPIAATGFRVLGMVKINTTRDLHDPDFIKTMRRACNDFGVAMHEYYC